MVGLFNRIYNALCVEEVTPAPKRRKPADRCSSCTFWVSASQIDSTVISSPRAIEWAKEHGYGRCQHRNGPANNKGDKKRFTLPDAYCANHEAKIAAPPPQTSKAKP